MTLGGRSGVGAGYGSDDRSIQRAVSLDPADEESVLWVLRHVLIVLREAGTARSRLRTVKFSPPRSTGFQREHSDQGESSGGLGAPRGSSGWPCAARAPTNSNGLSVSLAAYLESLGAVGKLRQFVGELRARDGNRLQERHRQTAEDCRSQPQDHLRSPANSQKMRTSRLGGGRSNATTMRSSPRSPKSPPVTSEVVDSAPSVGAAPPTPPPTGAASAGAADPEYVLVPHEARRRGFKNPLALRRFCLRLCVEFKTVGRKQFVRPRELDEAIARGGSPRRADPSANIAHAVDVLKRRR